MVPGGSLWMIDSDGARAGPGERCAPALAFLPPLSPRSVHFRLEIGRVPRRDRFEVPACRSPGAPGAAAPRTATAPRIFNVPHCPTHTAKSRNHAGPRSASRPSDVLELRGLITSPAFRLSHRDDWLPSSRARWQMPAGLREPISSRRSTDLGEGRRGAGSVPAPCCRWLPRRDVLRPGAASGQCLRSGRERYRALVHPGWREPCASGARPVRAVAYESRISSRDGRVLVSFRRPAP